MKIAVVSIFPDYFSPLQQFGITSRALANKILELSIFNPRDYCNDRHRQVDDRPYGGGPGMVMKPEPLAAAIEAATTSLLTGSTVQTRPLVIYLSPQGAKLTQAKVQELAQLPQLVLVSGRYEGIDERIIASHVDSEYSIGDYVLSGGELPAMVLIDAVCRLQDGALHDPESAQQDSFSDGWLDCPHYTRPEEFAGKVVPEVLLSGDHRKIAEWRRKEAIGRTWQKRPDWLKDRILSDQEKKLLEIFIAEQAKE